MLLIFHKKYDRLLAQTMGLVWFICSLLAIQYTESPTLQKESGI